ncbi:MAG: Hsp20/alpha crystallin family protein [Anaerolineales bacterium]|nr:Hsp20/alpha crystallin family protein [Chloroflexota bacterium]MBL6980452.1 Hsp20/alpha crystallin family protein [Anaerolineales bacterium]
MKDIDLKSNKSPKWFAANDHEGGVSHFHFRIGPRSSIWSPPTDVFETDDFIIVRVEVAGMENGEFAISLEDQILTIQGARFDPPERRAYHQMEIRFGEFISQVGLHRAVDQDKIDAKYEDGFLRIALPKTKPHQVEIKE